MDSGGVRRRDNVMDRGGVIRRDDIIRGDHVMDRGGVIRRDDIIRRDHVMRRDDALITYSGEGAGRPHSRRVSSQRCLCLDR